MTRDRTHYTKSYFLSAQGKKAEEGVRVSMGIPENHGQLKPGDRVRDPAPALGEWARGQVLLAGKEGSEPSSPLRALSWLKARIGGGKE